MNEEVKQKKENEFKMKVEQSLEKISNNISNLN